MNKTIKNKHAVNIVTATKIIGQIRYTEHKYRIYQIRYWKNIVTANFDGKIKK